MGQNSIMYNFTTNGGNQNTKFILENDVHVLIQKANTIIQFPLYVVATVIRFRKTDSRTVGVRGWGVTV